MSSSRLIRRQLIQGLVVAGAWALFILSWIKVLRTTPATTMLLSAGVVGVTLLTVTGLTSWWIRHNVNIFRRLGPRRSVPAAARVVGSDFLDRDVVADWETVRNSSVVVVRVGTGRKEFVTARPER